MIVERRPLISGQTAMNRSVRFFMEVEEGRRTLLCIK